MTPLRCRTSLAVGLLCLLGGSASGATQAQERADQCIEAVKQALTRSKPDEAAREVKEALRSDLLDEGKEGMVRGYLLQEVGLLFFYSGHFTPAEGFLKQSLACREKLQPRQLLHEFLSHSNLGVLYRNMENYGQAIVHYNACLALQAEDRAGKVGPVRQARVHNNLGYLYERTGK